MPECCEKINQSLSDSNKETYISNWQLKNLLIEKFQEEIGFTYQRKRDDSQMFFSVNLRSIEMAEQLQSNDFAAEYAKLLQKELLDFDFGLEGSCCDGDDVSVSYKNYKKTSFVMWKKFCSILLQGNMSTARQRICDTVFQILFKMVHANTKNTIWSRYSSLHELSRSKHLIELFNRLGISVSYAIHSAVKNLTKMMIKVAVMTPYNVFSKSTSGSLR